MKIGATRVTQKMETPVIYFHTQDPIRVLARNTAIDHARRTRRAPRTVPMPPDFEAEDQGPGELAHRVLWANYTSVTTSVKT